MNINPTGFSRLGVQSTIQHKFTENLVGAAGVLLTAAGQNNIDAIYPNFSLYH